jgi:hypothetical protein
MEAVGGADRFPHFGFANAEAARKFGNSWIPSQGLRQFRLGTEQQ